MTEQELERLEKGSNLLQRIRQTKFGLRAIHATKFIHLESSGEVLKTTTISLKDVRKEIKPLIEKFIQDLCAIDEAYIEKLQKEFDEL